MVLPELNEQGCYDVAPATNVKCIVFTAFVFGVWMLPRNKWILLPILFLPYAIMAYYDFYYKCNRTFGPTFLMHFYKYFKPKETDQNKIYDNWCPHQKRKVDIVDSIVLIVFLILFYYFYIRKKK